MKEESYTLVLEDTGTDKEQLVITKTKSKQDNNIALKVESPVQTTDINEPEVNVKISSFDGIIQFTYQGIKREKQEKLDIPFHIKSEEEIAYEKDMQKTIAETTLQKEVKSQNQIMQSERETKSSLIIEKPNYELMEELPKRKKKVLSIRENKTTHKPKLKLKYAILGVTLGLFIGISISNTVMISALEQSYIEATEKYELNLAQLIQNVEKLDITSEGVDFIETYPDEGDVGTIAEQTNWFDKICNFFSRLFGG